MLSIVLVVLCACVTFSAGYYSGIRNGRERERRRVEILCEQGIRERWSGTARWIVNAVSSGADKLVAEDEFFGPEKRE